MRRHVLFAIMIGALVLEAPAAAGSKDKSAHPAGGPAQTPCDRLTKEALSKASSVAELEWQIAQDAQKPAPNLKGIFKSWMGETYVSDASKAKAEKLTKDRKGVQELAALVQSLGCPAINVEEEIKKAHRQSHPEPARQPD